MYSSEERQLHFYNDTMPDVAISSEACLLPIQKFLGTILTAGSRGFLSLSRQMLDVTLNYITTASRHFLSYVSFINHSVI